MGAGGGTLSTALLHLLILPAEEYRTANSKEPASLLSERGYYQTRYFIT